MREAKIDKKKLHKEFADTGVISKNQKITLYENDGKSERDDARRTGPTVINVFREVRRLEGQRGIPHKDDL